MSKSEISFESESQLVAKAESIYNRLGLDLSTALNLFLKATVREGDIPFSYHSEKPSKRTRESAREINEIKENRENQYFYTDLDDFFTDLGK
ncbi:MAG: type II toxin-antitoxin system RelB/DinJ family antitoxin [Coprobacillus sp.]|nr:type II toxin-antitoxin system RelB/DinJ family antitoxin [Coprobacillus sp.]